MYSKIRGTNGSKLEKKIMETEWKLWSTTSNNLALIISLSQGNNLSLSSMILLLDARLKRTVKNEKRKVKQDICIEVKLQNPHQGINCLINADNATVLFKLKKDDAPQGSI